MVHTYSHGYGLSSTLLSSQASFEERALSLNTLRSLASLVGKTEAGTKRLPVTFLPQVSSRVKLCGRNANTSCSSLYYASYEGPSMVTDDLALLNRNNLAKIMAKDVMTKDPDPLKSEARVAFSFPAKGRKGVHHEVAVRYLKERVSQRNKRI